MNAGINVDGLGFRGGVLTTSSYSCSWTNNTNAFFYTISDGRGASKGEGVALYIAGKQQEKELNPTEEEVQTTTMEVVAEVQMPVQADLEENELELPRLPVNVQIRVLEGSQMRTRIHQIKSS